MIIIIMIVIIGKEHGSQTTVRQFDGHVLAELGKAPELLRV